MPCLIRKHVLVRVETNLQNGHDEWFSETSFLDTIVREQVNEELELNINIQ
jgi:hypothetical protein